MAPRLTPSEKALRTITEREWQKSVTALMTAYGWHWWHSPDNRPVNGRIQNIRPGLPDLIAARGSRLLFVELKRETGKTTPEQDTALAALGGTGAEIYVWRPRDIAEARQTLMPSWGQAPPES